MKKLTVIALFFNLFITGCAANKHWVNPSVSNEQAQKDFLECQYDIEK